MMMTPTRSTCHILQVFYSQRCRRCSIPVLQQLCHIATIVTTVANTTTAAAEVNVWIQFWLVRFSFRLNLMSFRSNSITELVALYHLAISCYLCAFCAHWHRAICCRSDKLKQQQQQREIVNERLKGNEMENSRSLTWLPWRISSEIVKKLDQSGTLKIDSFSKNVVQLLTFFFCVWNCGKSAKPPLPLISLQPSG